MIDLSTLIAILTALASVTAADPIGAVPSRADEPSAQHCSGSHGPTSSGNSQRAPAKPRTIILSAPPAAPNGPSGTSDDAGPQHLATHHPATQHPETLPSATQQLRGDTDEEDTEPETPTTTRASAPTPDPDGDESDRTTKQPGSDRGAPHDRPSTTPPRAPGRPTDGPRDADLDHAPDSDEGSDADADRSGGPAHDRADPQTEGDSGDPRPTRGPDTPQPPSSSTSPGDRSPDDSRCADPPPDREPDQEPDRRTDREPDQPPGRPTTDASNPSDAQAPSDLVDLNDWYLTLPTGADGDPDTVQPPELAGYSSTYFRLNSDRDGVVFTAPVAGVTTKNSHYPRSELREMKGAQEAAWSNQSGTHTLRATEAVTELPDAKPELVTAQIHGGDDDIMQIRLEGTHLMVQYGDGTKQVSLDPDYRLGTPYELEIVAATGGVRVSYNGEQKADLPLSGNTWYFKAGAYVQSNPSKGDADTAAGQVVIYSLEVTHT